MCQLPLILVSLVKVAGVKRKPPFSCDSQGSGGMRDGLACTLKDRLLSGVLNLSALLSTDQILGDVKRKKTILVNKVQD